MKEQKFLPKPIVAGNIIDHKYKLFDVNGKPGVEFTVVYKDTWKDKETGEKKEGKAYFYNCVAFGKDKVDMIELAKEQKYYMSITVKPYRHTWEDKETGTARSKEMNEVTFIEAWVWDQGAAHTVDLKLNGDTNPF
jgi:single-stranded DNA-binding protein